MASDTIDVRVDDLHTMSIGDALLLAFYRRYWQSHPQKDFDGYVPIVMEKVEAYLNMPNQTRRRATKRLKKLGLIDYVYRGFPHQCFIRTFHKRK